MPLHTDIVHNELTLLYVGKLISRPRQGREILTQQITQALISITKIRPSGTREHTVVWHENTVLTFFLNIYSSIS